MKNTTPSHGFVYLIQAVGTSLVKIGYSVNPESRLASLRTGSPFMLEIVRVWNGRTIDEKAIHRRLQDKGSHLEWFEMPVSEATAMIDAYFIENPFTPPPFNTTPPPRPTKRDEFFVDIDSLRSVVCGLLWLNDDQKATLIEHICELAQKPRKALSFHDNQRIVEAYKYLREINFENIPEDRQIEQILEAGKVQQIIKDIRRHRSLFA